MLFNPFRKKQSNTQKQRPTGYVDGIIYDIFDGDKFPGSFGATKNYDYVDYWTLRERSMQLFRENLYCKGIIRRILRNEINTGLNLEADIVSEVVGIDQDTAVEIGTERETSWSLWANDPYLCDWKQQKTLGELAADARMTALLSGDCIIVLRINPTTGLPAVDLIDGRHVQTPFGQTPRLGNTIKHGIELDAMNRHVAYWVRQADGTHERIPCWGEKSWRRISWMIYGSERRLDDLRGEPILAAALYMLKELDRYRDSESRAATINAMLPMYVKKTQPGAGSRTFDGGAIRKGQQTGASNKPDEGPRRWNWAKWIPGVMPQTMAYGEEIESFSTNRPNVNFKIFEETIINVFSWTLEIPPEITRLLFQNNFSASRQANNEFEVYLKYRTWKHGRDFYQPIYIELNIQDALLGNWKAPGFLDAWRDLSRWKELNAWVNAHWTGISRPSVDIQKDVNACGSALDYGFCTQDWAARRISGQSYKSILVTRKREIDAMKKAGLSFQSEENNNREPLVTVPATPDNQAIEAAINYKMMNMMKRIDQRLTDIEDNIEGEKGI
ncbi:MAG: phage portal protein [Spirochaetes bacterium]|nr:phage portal protein [Spirochaetota bacterium]